MRRVILVAAYTALIMFGVVPLLVYFVVDRVTNGEPTAAVDKDNWVTALWTASTNESSWLSANFDPKVQRPGDVSYGLHVCEPDVPNGQPGSNSVIHGLFLLSGDARLKRDFKVVEVNADRVELKTDSSLKGSAVLAPSEDWEKGYRLPQEITDFGSTGGDANGLPKVSTANMQPVPFTLRVPPCNHGSGQEYDTFGFTRSEFGEPSGVWVHGSLRSQITKTFAIGPLEGPHRQLRLPALGVDITGAANPNAVLRYHTCRGETLGAKGAGGVGLPGACPTLATYPKVTIAKRLDAGSLAPGEVVESGGPSNQPSDELVFATPGGNQPVSALVRLTDLNELQQWKSIETVMLILVGIAGGIFGTLIITGLTDVAKRQRRDDSPAPPEPTPNASPLG